MSERSEQLNELAAALSKAQAEIANAAKSRSRPFEKGSNVKIGYSTLADVWDACRKPLTANGLSVIQQPLPHPEGSVMLRTLLLHSSGQFVESELTLPVRDHSAQAYGAALTYARRYALSAMVGVAPDDDDDGHSANGSAPQRPRQQAQPRNEQQAAPSGQQRVQQAVKSNERATYPAATGATNGNGNGNKSDLDRVRAAYHAQYKERFPNQPEDWRYCLEAVLVKREMPYEPGGKDGWDLKKWQTLLERLKSVTEAQITAADEMFDAYHQAKAEAVGDEAQYDDPFAEDPGAVPAGEFQSALGQL